MHRKTTAKIACHFVSFVIVQRISCKQKTKKTENCLSRLFIEMNTKRAINNMFVVFILFFSVPPTTVSFMSRFVWMDVQFFFIYISFGATFSVVIRGRTRAQAHATFAMEQRKNNMFRQMHFLFRSDSSCRNVVSVDVELNVVLFVFFFILYFFLRFSRFKWNLLKSINGMWEHSLLSLLCISLLSSLDATEAFIAIETYACCGVQTISTYWIA